MLDAETIRTARGEAARSGRPVLDVLEERCGLHAGALVAGLAGALGYRAATMAELERAQSAFDVVPYADAAALMLSNLENGNAMSRHRVGLALPVDMRGRKARWTAKP